MSSFNDSNDEIPEVFPNRLENEINMEAFALQEREHERVRTEHRLNEMNRQIMELTSLVRSIAEQNTSQRREGNDVMPTASLPATRSDMVTGVPRLVPPPPNSNPPRRTPSTTPPQPELGDVLTEIHQHLRSSMTDGVLQPKILQTQVPLFKGNREKYNEFEHLLLNHLRPHMNRLTEEQKLNYFQSLLRDEAIEFWQTLQITTMTTLTEILQAFKKEYAKDDLKEVSKFKFDQLRYDPSTETFNDFLNKFKKIAKQAFGDKANEYTETFLFGKLPVQMQNELAIAGKHDAKLEEIKTFVQRRCQYAQLLPQQAIPQPFNQIAATPPVQPTEKRPRSHSTHDNNNAPPAQVQKKKFDGYCNHCGIYGHKWAECRKRLREQAQNPGMKQTNDETTKAQPRYNAKLVCQICGKVGHSARDCHYRHAGASAYRNVPYNKQSTTENKQFRKDFRTAQNRQYPVNEITVPASQPDNESENEIQSSEGEESKNL